MASLPNFCETCVVRNRAICSDLETEEISALNRIARRQKMVAGQSLYWEGDAASLVGNVIEGVLKLTRSLSDGREQVVGLLFPSDFIGRPLGDTVPHSLVALSDAMVCTFPTKDFQNFAAHHPRLCRKLLERTLDELDRTREWMVLLARKSAGERVASFLLEMGDRLTPRACIAPVNGSDEFELPFGRQQIADTLGLTIETVSRRLTELKRREIIDLVGRRGVRILDRPLLEAEAEICA